jgi:hypothetical protein
MGLPFRSPRLRIMHARAWEGEPAWDRKFDVPDRRDEPDKTNAHALSTT